MTDLQFSIEQKEGGLVLVADSLAASQFIAEQKLGGVITLRMATNQRTSKQNNAMHLWCDQSAEVCRDAGLDWQAILKAKTVSVPVTKNSFKEVIFKQILEIMYGHDSTAKAETPDYSHVVQVIQRQFAEAFGVVLPPFPSRGEG